MISHNSNIHSRKPTNFDEIIKSKASRKFIEKLVFICLVITMWNIYNWVSSDTTSKLGVSVNKDILQSQLENLGLQTRRSIKHTDFLYQSTLKEVDMINQKELEVKKTITQKRVIMGIPQLPKAQLIIYKIVKSKNKVDSVCSLISSINIVTKVTVSSIIQLIQNEAVDVVLLLTKKINGRQKQKMLEYLISTEYQVTEIQTVIDSDYKFILSVTSECEKIIYTFGNFRIDSHMAANIYQEAKNVRGLTLLYSSTCLYRDAKIDLAKLSDKSLQEYPPSSFYQYLYIFDAKFLSIITPLNFAYYAKYTMQEILLLPVLALVQQSGLLKSSNKIMHSFDIQAVQYAQFALQPPKKQQSSICFISYPSDPFKASKTQFQKYIQKIHAQKNVTANISIVVYVPYSYGSSSNLILIVQKIRELMGAKKQIFDRIRLRARGKKAVAAHAVYESVYNYCPDKAMIVSSRHNVLFDNKFVNQVFNHVVVEHHYYHMDYNSFQDNATKLIEMPKYSLATRPRKTDIFVQHFRHFQIFKSDLLKTTMFHALKCAQTDFYQTQAAFTIAMVEQIKLRFVYVNQTLVTVLKRSFTPNEEQQIKNVKSYTEYTELMHNQLNPFFQNALQNDVYKRFAPLRMPKNIHQIWISQTPISDLRQALQDSIMKNNPQFQLKLWRLEDVTKQNFPLTYHFVHRTFEFHKTSEQSFYALAADLLRYELLYRLGGIYVDFKMEGTKSADNWLKYEVFYLDCDVSYFRFNRPQVIGIGVMGGTPNNYHLKVLLTELILQQTINYKTEIPYQTGSFVARRSFNDEQFLKVLGLGFHLLLPKPYEPIVNACGGQGKQFQSDQTVYQVTDFQTQKVIRIGLPCRQYPQAYFISYTPLARTWKHQKRDNLN